MRASTCKGCGAAIVWIRTPGGKSMPCDATPRYYIEKPRSGSKKIVTPNGEVISCEYTEDPDDRHRLRSPLGELPGGRQLQKVRVAVVSLFIFILVLQCVSQERLPAPTVEEFTSMALWVLCDIELLKLVFGKR